MDGLILEYFPWSRIMYTPLAMEARKFICSTNAKLDYHNWDHVVSMYKYLDKTDEPYDEALDWAILFHDIVYDQDPLKEQRSADMFYQLVEEYEGCTPDIWERKRVGQLILATVYHKITDDPKSGAIIRADLHGLTNRLTTMENFVKILKESTYLYGITEVEFAKNSEKFMTDLLFRICSNIGAESEHKQFYLDAAEGAYNTTKLARLIQGKENA